MAQENKAESDAKMILIAEQQLKIAALEKTVKQYSEGCLDIHYLLYNIGGPLNDNQDQYSFKQSRIFFKIAEILEAMGTPKEKE